ncbi:MAG: bifunctional UDP-N-acetylglucosamine diphosphorylase/glucosamine-1-phosphate N-acetyltransferase GlmU [Firmicutes bacterium]|nr:bifunctional UDP-N-acetylglucosamine diphosphorylase/glucosamine-1-phosphate N-acetyltransferase GlmU [Bacillota bacterium]
MRKMSAVILAAGKGTRMKSELPKVLHQLGHKPMAQYVIDAARGAGVDETCVVVGHGAEAVKDALGGELLYALQEPQLGTGHALQQALPICSKDADSFLVLCGDTPLLTAETLRDLRGYFELSKAACTVMSAVLPDGGSYGRIVRDGHGNLSAIVEAKDANVEQLAICEINSGVYCFDSKALKAVINDLRPNNSQGEYYLTDVISAIRENGGLVNAYICRDAGEISGVNDRCQLAEAGKILRRRKNRQLMNSGITMVDPDTVYIDDDVEIGPDCLIEPQVYIEGPCRIGANCHIGPSVMIIDSTIGNDCEIGPFCLIRPGTVLEDKAKAGHFVELKKSHIGHGSKVPHLSYLGDATVGRDVNIGCGTITCNYDGKNKYPTVIEDEAFIGSNTNLVAPVTIGRRSTVGAGSTITADVPEDTLALGRGRQCNIEGWTKERDPRYVKKDEE